MQLVESRIALHGANLYSFNLTDTSDGMVELEPIENGLFLIRYNKKQGTMAVMKKKPCGGQQLIAIGFIGHGCVIFDCLYFDSSLNPFIKLIAKIK